MCAPGRVVLATSLLAGLAMGLTTLEDYVASFDPHYQYTVLDQYTLQGSDFTLYYLNMTSLKWLDETLVDAPIWWHYLVICVPQEVDPSFSDRSFLHVGNGARGDPPPSTLKRDVSFIVNMARKTRTVAAYLSNIPNQPLTFSSGPWKSRQVTETDIMFAQWWQFLHNETARPDWLALFAMTKAGVRSLDTVTDFMLKLSNGRQNITKFMVSGVSKRGWTTWLLAAVDDRVVAFVPISCYWLNVIENFHRHYRCFGGWTVAHWNFQTLNLSGYLDSPRFQEMMGYIDPFYYMDRYQTKPKLLVFGSGDEFFSPDGTMYFYEQLPGTKYLRRDFRYLAPLLGVSWFSSAVEKLVLGFPFPELCAPGFAAEPPVRKGHHGFIAAMTFGNLAGRR
ncbi:Autocrine proliferation repressor protein A [Tupaia chinensis]|uniref:Autocrine proliferation repressor protein A n=1 Tax=Tupaia chinensis TaxID=246437 RepID=L9KZW3_TUPCH|nr:Autocrine proliferation repressor protein A [Tupaia chinensis]